MLPDRVVSGDEEPRVPFASVMDAFVLDCLSRFGLRPGGGALSSDTDRRQLLSTAWPPAPLPSGYDDADGLNDFVAYLHSALRLATVVSCARCGASGELPPETLGLLVIMYRRSEDDQEAARFIDLAVRAGMIQCDWGTSGDEFLCFEHANRKSRKQGRAWWGAWNETMNADIHAHHGIWEPPRRWRDPN